ncbi:hypothetical protein BLOT_014441 [Blomia tropicalis]|nr:hypothetical protein BLOT_014441 [Blomia tropicalis]
MNHYLFFPLSLVTFPVFRLATFEYSFNKRLKQMKRKKSNQTPIKQSSICISNLMVSAHCGTKKNVN